MAVRYGSKKYYREKYADKCDEVAHLNSKILKMRDAFNFIYQNGGDPYRVGIFTYGGISANHYGTHFKYVDKEGVLHEFDRAANTNKIKVLSTDAEGALICYQATKPYTYYHLDKVKETFTEIPAKYMCDFAIAND